MIQQNSNRFSAVLYTCGLCNLNCRYCNIDKSPILLEIDKKLEESFKGDYYFNRIKEYFPRRDQLKEVQTWGGEPFLAMERIYPLVHKLIDYYPYFNTMFSSTNFSYAEWLDKFTGLMHCFEEHPEREFTYNLQLSVDGPEEINDNNRGKGVTKRCIENFNKLINLIKEKQFPSNITLNLQLKGTWDLDVIHKLNDKQALINFFQFYENNYMDPVQELNNPKIILGCSVPNTAVPAPTTKEDGKIFAQLIKKCREIELENLSEHYFKYYTNITPYAPHACNGTSVRCGGCGCGTGVSMVGFLPDNMISICHEGFVQLVDAYKEQYEKRDDSNLTINIDKFVNDNPIPMCITDDQAMQHEFTMYQFNNWNSSERIATAATMIQALAMAKQIDECYLDNINAVFAASYIRDNCAFCIKNNYGLLGSYFLEPTDLYKLLLNGALQYLVQGGAYGNTCCGQDTICC